MDTTDDDEFEYYIVHDSIGVSHIMRTKRGVPPQVMCVNCED